MPAIITEQFRVMNAETFVQSLVSVGNTSNTYYTFIGQPNSLNTQAGGSLNWGDGLSPLDGFDEENSVKETILALKKVTNEDVRRMIRKVEWTSGTTYEMYRHDYNIYNLTPVTNQPNLYDSNFYVINEDFRVLYLSSKWNRSRKPKRKTII